MTKSIYTLYDKKTSICSDLMVFANDGEAVRYLAYSIKPDSMVGMYPDDYDLLCVGTFDTTCGQVISTYDSAHSISQNHNTIRVKTLTEILNKD